MCYHFAAKRTISASNFEAYYKTTHFVPNKKSYTISNALSQSFSYPLSYIANISSHTLAF